MRPIKFRAWDERKKKFLEYRISWEWGVQEQFTGLKTEAGVDIYEGDIVKVSYFDNDDEKKTETIGTVVFNDCGCYFAFMLKHDNNTVMEHLDYVNDYEVIGNIHENPELLK
jgi:uncharacterized phage protein (TIGR01671 family)